MSMDGINEVFIKISLYLQKRGYRNVMKMLSPLIHKVDEQWIITFNPLKETTEIKPEGMMGCDVPFMHYCIFYNGWLWGLVSLNGASVGAGSVGNLDNFYKVINE